MEGIFLVALPIVGGAIIYGMLALTGDKD